MSNSRIQPAVIILDGGSPVGKQLGNEGSAPSSAAAAAPSVSWTGDVVSAADQAACSGFPSGPPPVPRKHSPGSGRSRKMRRHLFDRCLPRSPRDRTSRSRRTPVTSTQSSAWSGAVSARRQVCFDSVGTDLGPSATAVTALDLAVRATLVPRRGVPAASSSLDLVSSQPSRPSRRSPARSVSPAPAIHPQLYGAPPAAHTQSHTSSVPPEQRSDLF